ncbi:alpha-D-ribose 1-methylphosphonate 5-triphosphate diphosphatase [Allorhizobium taibaishanense]|uniref:Alpha-D-ribose 1-methylphosphonate 5-triphosphate diphosphatase n=2 Tax=Allorhizobium taibaishanense TaxID=887144 RepID=A0A7W6HKC1_9HYPH|nr:alpha-D-ribose 1-methylphosphonate 5-triphosphate diphosphatase [Allorhizobium taibaishanense]MBB4006832.1 alpha-D-ribose 1-methylphosphonate 5-triphosphate diphosphatase [Allorhizobium taibaishanense]
MDMSGKTSTERLILTNATLVLADRMQEGTVEIENGRIVGLGPVTRASDAIDMGGDLLIPGLVDIHTDHFEKHVFPRHHVRWNYMTAALAHDAQIIGAGITTVFDSLCVGAAEDGSERAEILAPMIEALEKAQAAGMLRAEHLVHLRCEVIDPQTPALMEANIGHDLVRVISVMEHLPGIRQTRDLDTYLAKVAKLRGEALSVTTARVNDMIVAKREIGQKIRPQVVDIAKRHNMPLLSHDDTDIEHVDLAADEGVAISEFPCTLEAAREARRRGMQIVGGAPNIVRGGSQSGNLAVRDLLLEGLCDILASDYVPRALLDAPFVIAADADLAYDLPAAIRMVTKTPAEAAGLMDRGEIAPGKRADLLQVSRHDGHPFIKRIWREGVRVA